MEIEELKIYIKERIDLVSKKEVTDQLDYSNGILFHAIPNDALASAPVDWSNENQIKTASSAFSHLIKDSISFSNINDGQIGTSETAYAIIFNNGNIEVFCPRIVKQTPINFPPKIRYVQVENVVSQSISFIESISDLLKNTYSSKPVFTVFITLIGVKGIVFNATDQDYTTTIAFPDNSLSFQINDPLGMNREDAQEAIEEAIHKTLYEFEPVV